MRQFRGFLHLTDLVSDAVNMSNNSVILKTRYKGKIM